MQEPIALLHGLTVFATSKEQNQHQFQISNTDMVVQTNKSDHQKGIQLIGKSKWNDRDPGQSDLKTRVSPKMTKALDAMDLEGKSSC